MPHNHIKTFKTHNSVQQANSLNKRNMQTIESSSPKQIKALEENSKAHELNRITAKRR